MALEPHSFMPNQVDQSTLAVETSLFFVVQADGVIREANPAFLSRFDTTLNTLEQNQLNIFALLGPESRTQWEQQWLALAKQGYLAPFPVQFEKRNGENLTGQVYITALRDGTGAGACLLQPEPHPPQQALTDWDSLLQPEADTFAAVDAQFCLTAFNPAYRGMFQAQYGAEPQVGKSLIDLLAHLPEAQAMAIDHWGRALRGETFATFTQTGHNGSTAITQELHYGTLTEDGADGQAIGAYQIGRNITPQCEPIEMMHYHEKLSREFDTTFEQVAVGMAQVDAHRKFLRINRKYCDLLGYSREELAGLDFSNITHPDDLAQDQELHRALFQDEADHFSLEKRYIRKDGSIIWVRLTVARITNQQGKTEYNLVVAEDITERKQTELALQESEERFRLLANASPAQIFDMAPDGTMRFINQTTVDFYGPEREQDIMTGNWATEIHPDDLEKITGIINHSLKTRSAYRAEVRSRRKDGEYRWLLSTSTPSFYSNGDFYGLIGYNLDITALKEAEFALRESEERFRIMADVSVAHIFDVASDGKIRFINSTMLEFYSPKQIEALHTGDWQDLVHPEDQDKMLQALQQALESHQGYRIEVRFKNRHGQYRWLLSSVEPSFYPTGQLHGLVGSAIDITDIKQAELAARESEERFRIMANASPSHIFQIAPDGTTQFINQTAVDFFEPGTVEAFKRGDDRHLVHPDDAEQLSSMIQSALRTHKGYRLELRMKRKDGQYRWLLSSVEPSLYPNGELHSLIGSAIDITEMKQTEFALRESEERFRIMADASPLQIYDVGPDGKLRYVNKAARDFYGPENEEKILQNGWLDFVHPEDRERLGKPMPPMAELEPVSKEEFRILRKDGEYRWVMTYTAPSFYANGELHGLVGSAIDITERKLMEQALQQSESRWSEMANAVPIILWVTDAQGQAIFINDRWYQYSGLTPEQSLGSKGMEAVHPDDRELVRAIAAKYIQLGEPYEIEARYRSAQGHYRWHLSRAVPVKDENGKILNWYGSSLDIQDRRLMEQELSKARDIAEEASKKKSQFLANMSHELRTPLNAVIGFSDMLNKGMAGTLSGKQHGYVEHISTSGRHLLTMVNDILDISKAEAGKIELFLQYVELEPFIKQLRELISYSAEKNAVQLEFEVQSGLVGLVADPDRLKQIFLNLISNAIKFNHEGGQVNVFLGRSEDYQWVICEIHDTGIGIPQNQMDKLFSEFYQVDSSNARRYEGTGLGLALTKRLVELHHGTIMVESQEEVGSIFTFKLPLNPYAMGF